jgi:hypothetical protein
MEQNPEHQSQLLQYFVTVCPRLYSSTVPPEQCIKQAGEVKRESHILKDFSANTLQTILIHRINIFTI